MARIGSHVWRSAPTHVICRMLRYLSSQPPLLHKNVGGWGRHNHDIRPGEKPTMALSLRTELYAVNN